MAYRGGAVSLLEVLDEDRQLLAARDLLAQVQSDDARSAVAAFRAMRIAEVAACRIQDLTPLLARMLSRWSGGNDVPDPYRQERIAFEHVFALIDQGVSSWMRYL